VLPLTLTLMKDSTLNHHKPNRVGRFVIE